MLMPLFPIVKNGLCVVIVKEGRRRKKKQTINLLGKQSIRREFFPAHSFFFIVWKSMNKTKIKQNNSTKREEDFE